jgi:predicted Co/Zn/Cd cation transporter (cation efflux family)
MGTCTISPSDRRKQVQRVGDDLVKNYGKKRYYTVQEVKAANQRQYINLDFSCWSYATFNTRNDFDTYHQSIGETCDYDVMKGEMLNSISNTTDASWFDIDLSWLEFPDIDWSIFDFFDL